MFLVIHYQASVVRENRGCRIGDGNRNVAGSTPAIPANKTILQLTKDEENNY